MKKSNIEIFLTPILTPLVRYCLAHSFHLQDIVEILKKVMQDEASRLLLGQGEKVNASRISALTGIHRKDISRLNEADTFLESKNIMTRIIGQWQYDRRFLDKAGRPSLLKLDDSSSSLRALVESVSTDLHPGTILFELERLGVMRRRGNVVKLVKTQLVVGGDVKMGLELLSADLDDLLNSVQTNLKNKKPVHLHGRTEFDNIDPNSIPKIRDWLLKEGRAFHKRTREFLSTFDRDIFPKKGSAPGVKVAVGTFSFDNSQGVKSR